MHAYIHTVSYYLFGHRTLRRNLLPHVLFSIDYYGAAL